MLGLPIARVVNPVTHVLGGDPIARSPAMASNIILNGGAVAAAAGTVRGGGGVHVYSL